MLLFLIVLSHYKETLWKCTCFSGDWVHCVSSLVFHGERSAVSI